MERVKNEPALAMQVLKKQNMPFLVLAQGTDCVYDHI